MPIKYTKKAHFILSRFELLPLLFNDDLPLPGLFVGLGQRAVLGLQGLPVLGVLLVQPLGVAVDPPGLVLQAADGLEARAVALDDVPAGVEEGDDVEVASALVVIAAGGGAGRAEAKVVQFLIISMKL